MPISWLKYLSNYPINTAMKFDVFSWRWVAITLVISPLTFHLESPSSQRWARQSPTWAIARVGHACAASTQWWAAATHYNSHLKSRGCGSTFDLAFRKSLWAVCSRGHSASWANLQQPFWVGENRCEMMKYRLQVILDDLTLWNHNQAFN